VKYFPIATHSMKYSHWLLAGLFALSCAHCGFADGSLKAIQQSKDLIEQYNSRALRDDCFRRALNRLHDICPSQNQKDRQDLAFLFANCQLQMDGLGLVMCPNGDSSCPSLMTDKQYSLFSTLRVHLDSMCYWIRQDAQLASIQEASRQLHNVVHETESSINRLQRTVAVTSGKVESSVAKSMELLRSHSAQSSAHFSELSRRSEHLLKGQDDALRATEALSSKLVEVTTNSNLQFEKHHTLLDGISSKAAALTDLSTSQFQSAKERTDEVVGLLDRVLGLLRLVSGTAQYISVILQYAVVSLLFLAASHLFPSPLGLSTSILVQIVGLFVDIVYLKQPHVTDSIRAFVSTSWFLSLFVPASVDADSFSAYLSQTLLTLSFITACMCMGGGFALRESKEDSLKRTIKDLLSECFATYTPVVGVSGQTNRRSVSPSTQRSSRKG
jgi:hypothetical protein